MLRSIPFYLNISGDRLAANADLLPAVTGAPSGDKQQPEIVRRLAIDAFSILSTHTLDLMRTSTEFISEISAPTISTSFKFHLDFLVNLKEVDVYHVCMCMCFIVSIPCHTSPSICHDA